MGGMLAGNRTEAVNAENVRRIVYRALVLTLGLFIGCSHHHQQRPEIDQAQRPQIPLGMWVWRDTDFNTPTALEDLLSFCEKEGVTHLDVHTRLMERDGAYVLREEAAFAQLITQASQRGITVSALRGAPGMFLASEREQTLADLSAMIAFDASLRPGPGLLGIKYDVEPYATPQWRLGGDPKLQVVEDYLATLAEIRQTLDAQAPDLLLTTDIPFWWDKQEHEVEFRGRHQALSSHVQDLTDYVAIMSYRRGASQVIDCVQTEVAKATQIGRTICPSLETGQLRTDQHISFFGTDPTLMRTCIDSLRTHFQAVPAVRMIMLHHYGTVSAYLQESVPPSAQVPDQ